MERTRSGLAHENWALSHKRHGMTSCWKRLFERFRRLVLETPDRDCSAWRNEASSTAWSEKRFLIRTSHVDFSIGGHRCKEHARKETRGSITNVSRETFRLKVFKIGRAAMDAGKYSAAKTRFSRESVPLVDNPPSARRADARCCIRGATGADATRGRRCRLRTRRLRAKQDRRGWLLQAPSCKRVPWLDASSCDYASCADRVNLTA